MRQHDASTQSGHEGVDDGRKVLALTHLHHLHCICDISIVRYLFLVTAENFTDAIAEGGERKDVSDDAKKTVQFEEPKSAGQYDKFDEPHYECQG